MFGRSLVFKSERGRQVLVRLAADLVDQLQAGLNAALLKCARPRLQHPTPACELWPGATYRALTAYASTAHGILNCTDKVMLNTRLPEGFTYC